MMITINYDNADKTGVAMEMNIHMTMNDEHDDNDDNDNDSNDDNDDNNNNTGATSSLCAASTRCHGNEG